MEVYRHYKGGIYNVIGLAKHTETGEVLIVYEDTKGAVWVRPWTMFFEEVNVNGAVVKRFEHLGHFYK